MPMIQIRALPQKPGMDVPAALRRTCCDVAARLHLPPNQVWATWVTLAPGHYAEGDVESDFQPAGTHPPYVEVIAFEGRPPEAVSMVITVVAESLVAALELEAGNVFVVYHEAHAGRVYAGGEVRY